MCLGGVLFGSLNLSKSWTRRWPTLSLHKDVSFLNYAPQSAMIVKTAFPPPPSYHCVLSLHVHTHTQTYTNTQRTNAAAVSSGPFTLRSLVEASEGHKGRNGCCPAYLKIFDQVHLCLNIHMQPLACGKSAFKGNQSRRPGNSLSCALSMPYFIWQKPSN